MAYLVLAFPIILDMDYNKIQNFRKDNDELFYNVVEPHFTLVFPSFKLNEQEFIDEMKNNIKGINAFEFVIRCARASKDAFNDFYHSFFVLDEGFSAFIKLHDKLYSGELLNELRLDIDFVPHSGIGNSTDKLKVKKTVDNWNSKPFEIKGVLNSLDIVKYENDSVVSIEKLNLTE